MAYCTADQVRGIVDSDMEDAEITELITEVDAFMDLKLDSGSLAAVIKQGISKLWSAYRVMLKDPNAVRLGELSFNRAEQLRLLKKERDEMIRLADGGITMVVKAEPIDG